ncbi:uncharacterized protein ATC70_004451 [Mucor velutinosus]|uniref:Reverse transcriptase domain-containing protein n=2 Tax=Mucor velutinosus TaxID=708070 RepID=A0AAN7DRB1_9FUNG|nr:hypothetical protein ATC70_004451 [Mucor velutinosus]
MPNILPSLLIAGDMNYCFDNASYHHSHRAGKPKQFMEFLNTHFSDCLNPRNEPHAYTFKRGSTMSTLDYMFAGQDIASKMSDATNSFLRPEWTDHALVTKTYTTGLTNCGKGIWRANPHLAKNPRYRQKLADEIERFVATKLDYNLSAQDKWDLIKRKTKQVTINFARHQDTWRKARIKALQSERNNLLRCYRNDIECLKLLLPDVEGELSKLQQEIVEIQMLKAGRRWLEQSEKSPGYIKHTIDQRVDQRTIAMLKHPSTGEACLDTETKLNAAESFYQDLYTEEPIDMDCLNTMLGHIDRTVSPEDATMIMEPIDYDDILDGARRTPKQSSPGLDGIGYEILYLLVSHPSCRDIIHQVFNDAVRSAKFPKSWQASCIIILHKKGDKSDLANYRPITLIAADCKVFTRIMNSRVVQVANRIITPYQCGFLPGRYIGDHGMSLQVIMDNAQSASWRNPSNFTAYAGIMLDNAKAYDRVHPKYLSQVLLKFGFPEAFVTCITNLFFDNSIYVNVNGFLTGAISQRRGIRQGDSISPVLFNLAIEPFLLSIVNNVNLTGYSLQHVKLPHQIQNPWISPAPIKVLAYADDVLSFVKSQDELVELQDRLRVYNQASNAKINYSKSVAFPLHGGKMKDTDGQQVKRYVTTQLRMKWYDSHSTGYIKYLGYPLWFANHQRDVFVSELLGNIRVMTDIYGSRKVSLYGKANIANTLILSKLWHVIRVVSLPQEVLKKIKSTIYQFVMSGLFPPLKANSFFLPRDQGGLGLIDIGAQQKSLQFRYLRVLLLGNHGRLPGFTYQLLTHALRLTNDVAHHALPLLFPSARYKNTLNGLHPFLSMFNAMDICSLHRDWDRRPTITTIMSLPLLAAFNPFAVTTDLEFMTKDSVRRSCIRDFFAYDLAQHSLQFRPRSECPTPTTLNKVRRALANHQISFQRFVNHNNAGEMDFLPFVESMIYQQHPIFKLPNRELRFVMLDMANLDVGRHYSNQLSKQQWKAFYKNTMHYSARNLWYRMIHKQSSNQLAMAQRNLKHAASDRCTLCNEVEDAQHLLISCVHKLDVWDSSFNEFLSYPKTADPQLIYNSIMHFKLKHYYIYNYDLHITIYDLFATIMRTIWRHHYQQFYNLIPFNAIQVCRHIRTELLRLSNLRQLSH